MNRAQPNMNTTKYFRKDTAFEEQTLAFENHDGLSEVVHKMDKLPVFPLSLPEDHDNPTMDIVIEINTEETVTPGEFHANISQVQSLSDKKSITSSDSEGKVLHDQIDNYGVTMGSFTQRSASPNTQSQLLDNLHRPFMSKVIKTEIQNSKTDEPVNSFIVMSENIKHSEIIEKYQCDLCFFRSISRLQLAEHKNIHTGEKPYKCYYCSRTFGLKDSLKKHTKWHTGERSYQCDTCGLNFRTKYHLDWHYEKHTGIQIFQCHACHSMFTDKQSLNLHHMARCMVRTTVPQFVCEICNYAFDRMNELKLHKVAHGDRQFLKCKYCSKYFVWKYCLKRHLRLHFNKEKFYKKSFSCKRCRASYPTLSALHSHFVQKHRYETLECSEIKKAHKSGQPSVVFSDHTSKCMITTDTDCHEKMICSSCFGVFCIKHLQEELKLNPVAPNRPFKCKKCCLENESGQRSVSLVEAPNSSLTTPFKCKECSAEFSKKELLTAHMNTHTEDSVGLFTCETCKMVFYFQRDLSLHIQIEHCSFLYKCDDCDFYSPVTLLQHRELYYEEGEIHCTLCMQRFTVENKIEANKQVPVPVHRINPNVKPFVCGICGTGFSYMDDLATHLKFCGRKKK